MARPLRFVDGHIHSPSFVFIRMAGKLADAELLTLLDMADFAPAAVQEDWDRPCLYVTEDRKWIHVADDWLYSLWHKHGCELSLRLGRILPSSAIFSCSVGDSDHAMDFTFVENGELRRRLVLSDPHFARDRRVIEEDVGACLLGERQHIEVQNEIVYVLSLASALGVDVAHDLARIRCYAGSGRNKRQANQALQTTSVTRSGFGKVPVSNRQRRGV